jgi:hypothetical protein
MEFVTNPLFFEEHLKSFINADFDFIYVKIRL